MTEPIEPIDSREEAAKAVGISTGTLSKYEYVIQHGDADTVAAMDGGDKSINEAYTLVRIPLTAWLSDGVVRPTLQAHRGSCRPGSYVRRSGRRCSATVA